MAKKKKTEIEEIKKDKHDILEELIKDIKNKKHQEFLINYLKNGRNATKAYKQTYKTVEYHTAHVNGPRLLANTSIKEAVKKYNQFFWDNKKDEIGEMLKHYIDIATSDIYDVVEIKNGELKVKELEDIDNTKVIQEITYKKKHGQNGIDHERKVKLYDKLKALDSIAKILEMISDKAELSGTIKIVPAQRPDKKKDK